MISHAPRHVARTARGLGGAVAALAIVLTACGSAAPEGNRVASLGTQAPSSTTPSTGGTDGTGAASDSSTPSKPANPQTAFADYAKCMRAEGIDMPDPQVVKLGGTTNGPQSQNIVVGAETPGSGPVNGASTGAGPNFDPNNADYKAADAKCKPILDAAIGQIKIDPAVEAEQRKQMLAFAKCMRAQGIDFPDPTFQDGGGSISIHVAGGEDDNSSNGPSPDNAAFQAANKVCGKELGNGGPMVATSGSAVAG